MTNEDKLKELLKSCGINASGMTDEAATPKQAEGYEKLIHTLHVEEYR